MTDVFDEKFVAKVALAVALAIATVLVVIAGPKDYGGGVVTGFLGPALLVAVQAVYGRRRT